MKNQNFISVDQRTAISSYQEYFTVGETVTHQDTTVGQAIIHSFVPEVISNEVLVRTSKGIAHLDFLVKIK